jgi:predicted ATPase
MLLREICICPQSPNFFSPWCASVKSCTVENTVNFKGNRGAQQRNEHILKFDSPVVFFAGDNGSGKSTLLETLAVKCDLPTAGADDSQVDATLSRPTELANSLTLRWNRQTRTGFFLRAEDFFGFQKRINTLCDELNGQVAGYKSELLENPKDEGIQRAIGFISGQVAALKATYGENADSLSHGEAFFNFFQKRIAPRGLYLLDEPEAPLSPLRQLAFLSLIKEATRNGSQFIIASHSPILLAYPDAQIFDFNLPAPAPAKYEDLENVNLWRSFLNNPEAFLRRI